MTLSRNTSVCVHSLKNFKMSDIKITILPSKNPKALNLTYGFHETPFGRCLLALDSDRIAYLSFKTDCEGFNPLDHLKTCFPNANLVENPKLSSVVASDIFDEEKVIRSELKVELCGTDFQIEVWKALLEIKRGETASYEDVARKVGRPKAVRAVANACANNRVAYVVPCHRVVKKNGMCVGKYRWGVERKVKMLKSEGVDL